MGTECPASHPHRTSCRVLTPEGATQTQAVETDCLRFRGFNERSCRVAQHVQSDMKRTSTRMPNASSGQEDSETPTLHTLRMEGESTLQGRGEQAGTECPASHSHRTSCRVLTPRRRYANSGCGNRLFALQRVQ